MSSGRQIRGRAARFAGGTLLSRVTGAARDIVLASCLPTWLFDVFIVAFTIPNTLRTLIAEGATSSAIVPLYAAIDPSDRAARADFLRRALGFVVSIAALSSLLLLFGAGLLINLYAPGLSDASREQAVVFVRAFGPYVILLAWTAALQGVLTAEHRLGLVGALPGLLNLGLIAGAVASLSPELSATWTLTAGLYGAALVQLIASARALRHLGKSLWPKLRRWDALSGQMMGLLGPTLVLSAVYQAQVLLTRAYASYAGLGAQTYLYLGQRLIEVPLALVAASLSTALLPELSRSAAAEGGGHPASQGRADGQKAAPTTTNDTNARSDSEVRNSDRGGTPKDALADVEAIDASRTSEGHGKHHLLGSSLRGGLFLVWPVVLVLCLCGYEIADLLFGRGEFSAKDSAATAASLRIQALGLLPAFSARLLTPVFYARKRPSLLAYATVLQLVAYAACGAPLLRSHGHVGLALASTLALLVYAVTLAAVACRLDKTLAAALRAQTLPLLKQLTAVSLAAGMALLALPCLAPWPGWARLGAVSLGASSLYLVVIVALDTELRAALQRLLTRAQVGA